MSVPATDLARVDRTRYDQRDNVRLKYRTPPGITRRVVEEISARKNEPPWVLQRRRKALAYFEARPVPRWGPDLSPLRLDEITYYAEPDAEEQKSWDEVPEEIRKTFDRLGIPEAERKYLAGSGAQMESAMAYHNLKEEWEKQGVIFENFDTAIRKVPDLVKEYFMTRCVPLNDHKFAALHGAVFSGGTFIYVPPGVKVTMPLQAYFRMNEAGMGQFEHTLIIVDEGAEVHYLEACFPKGARVLANPDYKDIESLRVGDGVLTHTGTYKPVNRVYERRYTGTLYRIEYFGDSTQTIEVTEKHPFLAVRRLKPRDRNTVWRREWIAPDQLQKHDYLAIPVNRTLNTKKFRDFRIERWTQAKQSERFFVVKRVPMSPELFRLIGYYLAEGSVAKDSYLWLSFGAHERRLIADAKRCLRSVFGIKKVSEVPNRKNNGLSLLVASVEIARFFKQFGTRFDRKEIPRWVMLEAPEKQRELILGVYRGDGNYYGTRVLSGWWKEAFRITTGSEKLARQLRELLLRQGIVSFLNREQYRPPRHDMYTVGVTGAYLELFGTIVGKNVSGRMNGKRRASMFGFDGRYAYVPIKSITKRRVKNLSVYNLGVEDDESYVAHGVTVHNCSAPRYNRANLHAGCVEVYVKKGARARYTSIENWSRNTYNLNTKRAIVEEDGVMEWINGNLGSGVTMLYPSSMLKGKGAKTDFIGIAVAAEGQNQDTGSKAYHLAPYTKSTITAKSISKDGGITTYRGYLKVNPGAKGCSSKVQCDALLLDERSVSNTIPFMEVKENDVELAHEATVGRVGEEQLFYLQSRGLSPQQATQMIVAGFIEPVTKQLPFEYAVELNRLIELEMEGSVG